MKTNYSPQLFHDPMAIASGAQAGFGVLQTILGGIQSFSATRRLEKMQSPVYNPNKGIMDFYNQALQRYNVSPTASAMYKRQIRDIDRGVSTSIAALNDRRSGIAGASSILRAANDARLDANVAAENQQNQRFGQLGNAAQAKAGEERMAFQNNEIAPFERKYNLLSAKAGGGAQIMNAGISNAFGGLQNFSNMEMLKKMYPQPK